MDYKNMNIQSLIILFSYKYSIMSIYITVTQANLRNKQKNDVCFLVQSQQSVLKSKNVPPSQKPYWSDSFICSINEDKLLISVVTTNQEKHSINMGKFIIGQTLIKFNELYFTSQPRKQLYYQRKLYKGDELTGNLEILVYYNDAQNYIGEIQFYDMSKFEYGKRDRERSREFITKIETDSEITTPNLNNTRYRAKIPFYKGPCKSKNLFSCMDRPVIDESFYIVEKKY